MKRPKVRGHPLVKKKKNLFDSRSMVPMSPGHPVAVKNFSLANNFFTYETLESRRLARPSAILFYFF